VHGAWGGRQLESRGGLKRTAVGGQPAAGPAGCGARGGRVKGRVPAQQQQKDAVAVFRAGPGKGRGACGRAAAGARARRRWGRGSAGGARGRADEARASRRDKACYAPPRRRRPPAGRGRRRWGGLLLFAFEEAGGRPGGRRPQAESPLPWRLVVKGGRGERCAAGAAAFWGFKGGRRRWARMQRAPVGVEGQGGMQARGSRGRRAQAPPPARVQPGRVVRRVRSRRRGRAAPLLGGCRGACQPSGACHRAARVQQR
jgi:hypothetical protein